MKKQYKSILIYSGITHVLVNLYIIYLFKDLNPIAFRSFLYGGIPVQILAYVLVALYFRKKSK
jgi:hypothetical protein